MRLLIVQHLQAMLQRAELPVGTGQKIRFVRCNSPGGCKRCERIEGCWSAQGRITATKEQLVNLRKKFDLANAAAPTFQIKARPQFLPFGEMIANLVAHFADVCQR